MDPSDSQTNLKLKYDMLRLAIRTSAVSPGSTVNDYNLMLGDLDGLEISEQNQALNFSTDSIIEYSSPDSTLVQM